MWRLQRTPEFSERFPEAPKPAGSEGEDHTLTVRLGRGGQQ